LSVSILIPAFRPTYLRQAIASALTQGFEDFELVIGDDNPGEEVRKIVEEFQDRRIRYLRTSGAAGALENMRMLWSAASRPLVKYLFDDDLLMPMALIEMVAAMESYPNSSFCFSNRYIIDNVGRVLEERKSTTEGEVSSIQGHSLTTALLPIVTNRIGEFSNVMVNLDSGVEFSDIERFQGFDIMMLGDMAFYLNATRKAPAVRIGKTLAAFRIHGQQHSSPGYNPWFARSLCEWEVLVRCEYDVRRLDAGQALRAARRLQTAYASWEPQLPEIKHLQPELAVFCDELELGRAAGVTEAFRTGLARLTDDIEKRRLARLSPGAAGPD
jgi:glycosyltransferase involved in cell wall biosynthesis